MTQAPRHGNDDDIGIHDRLQSQRGDSFDTDVPRDSVVRSMQRFIAADDREDDWEYLGMISSVANRKASVRRNDGGIQLFEPPPEETQSACWRINGFRTRLVVWTIEQWEKLEDRPADAQYHPCGFWCALRIE